VHADRAAVDEAPQLAVDVDPRATQAALPSASMQLRAQSWQRTKGFACAGLALGARVPGGWQAAQEDAVALAVETQKRARGALRISSAIGVASPAVPDNNEAELEGATSALPTMKAPHEAEHLKNSRRVQAQYVMAAPLSNARPRARGCP